MLLGQVKVSLSGPRCADEYCLLSLRHTQLLLRLEAACSDRPAAPLGSYRVTVRVACKLRRSTSEAHHPVFYVRPGGCIGVRLLSPQSYLSVMRRSGGLGERERAAVAASDLGCARVGNLSWVRSSRSLDSFSLQTHSRTHRQYGQGQSPPSDALRARSRRSRAPVPHISPLLYVFAVFVAVLTLAALREQVLCILYVGGKHAEEEKRLLGTVSRENGSSAARSFTSRASARRSPINSHPSHKY